MRVNFGTTVHKFLCSSTMILTNMDPKCMSFILYSNPQGRCGGQFFPSRFVLCFAYFNFFSDIKWVQYPAQKPLTVTCENCFQFPDLLRHFSTPGLADLSSYSLTVYPFSLILKGFKSPDFNISKHYNSCNSLFFSFSPTPAVFH